jgi:hypothetical protein
MDWITVVKKLLPYLIGFMIGAALVGYIQQQRIKGYQADLKISRNNEKLCEDANKTNQATIGSLQQEVKAALKGCDAQLAVKETTLKNLKRINELKPGAVNGGSNESNKKNIGGSSSGDSILDALNGMYSPGSGGNNSKNGIRETASTGAPR